MWTRRRRLKKWRASTGPNAWVFRGTRMPVQTVFENLEAGMSLGQITEVFDVTPEEVKAVLHFASESLARKPTSGR
jgi:uncharacterized protein (DUF433 family)